MSRGFFIFALQLLICVAMAFLGLWTLVRPKSFQAFVHENFGLLPAVGGGIRLIPILVRLSSIFFLWYSYMLTTAFITEISWLAGIVARLVGKG